MSANSSATNSTTRDLVNHETETDVEPGYDEEKQSGNPGYLELPLLFHSDGIADPVLALLERDSQNDKRVSIVLMDSLTLVDTYIGRPRQKTSGRAKSQSLTKNSS